MPRDDPQGLWYQRAYTRPELARILSHAPASPFSDAIAPATARDAYFKTISTGSAESIDEGNGKEDDRKRAIQAGDECPICYEEILEGGKGKDELVYDVSPGGCGKPLHASCFKAWSSSAVGRSTWAAA